MIYPTEKLLPGAASRETQRGIAMAVLCDPQALSHEKAHAKCFMTYRAVEGNYSMEAWKHEVQPVKIGEISDATQRVRWMTSQATAEFYLGCLNGAADGLKPEIRTQKLDYPWKEAEEEGLAASWMVLHRSFIINWMRVRMVMAYAALLRGDDEECKQWVMNTLQHGFRQVSCTPFDLNPLRVMEMRDDWHAWVSLMLIGQRQGFIMPCHAPWATAEMIERDDGHLPYVRCLKKLGVNAPAERRIWNP